MSRVATWILVLALGAYPLVGLMSVVLSIENSTPVAVSYRAFYLLLSIVLILPIIVVPKRGSYRMAQFWLLAFWLVYVCRMVYEFYYIGISKGYASKGFIFYLAYGFGGCMIPALALSLSQRVLDHKTIISALVRVFTVTNLAMVSYLVVDNGLSMEIFTSRLRLGEESVISPIALSQYGGALVVLATVRLLLGDKNRGWIFVPLILLGITSLVMGASRGPLLVTFLVLLLILIDHFKRAFRRISYWLWASTFLLLMTFVTIKFVIPKLETFALVNRISITVNKGQGLSERSEQWSAAWEQFLSNPAVGNGIIEYAHNFYPHNMVLEVLMATGLVGGIFVFLLLAKVGQQFVNRHLLSEHQVVYLYLFLLFFGCSLFSLALITIAQVWILIGVIVALPLQRVSNSSALAS